MVDGDGRRLGHRPRVPRDGHGPAGGRPGSDRGRRRLLRRGGPGLVGQLQRNEYTRYQRYISRRRGKVFVLTGTASLFRAYALKAVADSRGDLSRAIPVSVYDTLAMTEDNEMTLGVEDARGEDGLADAVPRHHRGDAELASAVAAADALAARCSGEHRRLRADAGDAALLAAADRHRLRDHRPQRLLAAAGDHAALRRQLPLVWFWVGDRR